jgi:CelD/BcsL family acetyltransferase involved in cellulose biosynthesis
MDAEVIRDPGVLEDLAPEWAALAESCSARHFAWPYWCLPWWRHLGAGVLRVVVVRDGGGLVAVAPLHERRRGPVRAVRFLGHGVGAVSELVVSSGRHDAARAVWPVVLEPRDAYLDLLDYPTDGAGLEELREWAGPDVRIAPADVTPFVPVRGSFDDYFAARGSQLRRILRRSERALEGRGASFDVEVVGDAARVDELLPDITRVFDAAEAQNPRQHLLAPPWDAFTRDVLREAANANALRVFVGSVADRVAVFALTFRNDTSLAMWLNRFDPSFGDVGPGHLLFKEMVRYGFEQRVERVDFLLGDFRYKYLWCTEAPKTANVSGARGWWARIAGRGTLEGAGALRQLVARAPRPASPERPADDGATTTPAAPAETPDAPTPGDPTS